MSESGKPIEPGVHYALRMLNLAVEAKKGPLPEEEALLLRHWLNNLRENHAVLVYVPDTKEGFYYMDRGMDLFPPGHPHRTD